MLFVKLWFNETLAYACRSFLLEVDMFDFGVFFLLWLFFVASYLLLRISTMSHDEDFFGG